MSRISILGCGYLGFPLALRLLERGHTVLGSTTSKEKLFQLKAAGIQPFQISLSSQQNTTPIEEFLQADILFLNIPFKRSFKDPWDYQKQIQYVLESIPEGSIDQIIFASSTSVYPSSSEEATEELEIEPEHERAKALLAIETELLAYQATILRFAGLYGYSRQIGRFLHGKKNMGHGQSPVNLVHLDDCTAIIERVMAQKIKGEVLNVCSDEHPTREALYGQKAQALGVSPPEFDQTAIPSRKRVSNQKLKNMLNYSFLYPNPLIDE